MASWDGYDRDVPQSMAGSQKIYSLITGADSKETLHTNYSGFKTPSVSTSAKPSDGIPVEKQRIRVLLAPAMSPYVVPMHKVQTWDALHRTLHSLFGADIFHGSPPRITDHKNNTILPLVWKDVLENDMTIIVDTYSNPPQEPAIDIFETARMHTKNYSRANLPQRNESLGHFESTTAMILAEKEKEYMDEESASPTDPFTARSRRSTARSSSTNSTRQSTVKSNPRNYTTTLKRQTSVNMFTERPRNSENGMPRQRTQPTNRELYRPAKSVVKFDSVQPFGHSYKISAASGVEELSVPEKRSSALYPRSPTPPRQMRRRSTWSRVAKALMFVLKAGASSERRRKQEVMKRSISNPTRPVHHRNGSSVAMDRKVSLSERRGAPALQPVKTGKRSSSSSPRRPANRRSKSDGAFVFPLEKPALAAAQKERPAAPARQHMRSESKPPESTPRLNGSSTVRKLAKHRKENSAPPAATMFVSPPIPPRPSGALGVNAQYKTPGLDRDRLHEYVANTTSSADNLLDGSTLAGSTLGSSSSWVRQCHVVADEPERAAAADGTKPKPLPKLPPKLSPFPPRRDPPLTPLEFRCVGADGQRVHMSLPDADRRPTTAESVVSGHRTAQVKQIRRVATAGIEEARARARASPRLI